MNSAVILLKSMAVLILASVWVSLTGCGGGGGGSDESENDQGPATVKLAVDPKKFDSGDHTEVIVTLRSFKETAVALKVRFPVALSYVQESGIIIVDDVAEERKPNVKKADTEFGYAVFYISTTKLGIDLDDTVEIVFELVGNESVEAGKIEIDVDIDDPKVENNEEFVVATPKFDPQAEADIVVGPAIEEEEEGDTTETT
jgi:hypothetical protein